MIYEDVLREHERIKKQITEKLNNFFMLGISESKYCFISRHITYEICFFNQKEINFFLKKEKKFYSKYYIKYNIHHKIFSIEIDSENRGFEEEKYAILAFYEIIISNNKYFLEVMNKDY